MLVVAPLSARLTERIGTKLVVGTGLELRDACRSLLISTLPATNISYVTRRAAPARAHGDRHGPGDGARDRIDHGLAAAREGRRRLGDERHDPPGRRRARRRGGRQRDAVGVRRPRRRRARERAPAGERRSRRRRPAEPEHRARHRDRQARARRAFRRSSSPRSTRRSCRACTAACSSRPPRRSSARSSCSATSPPAARDADQAPVLVPDADQTEEALVVEPA